MNAVVNKWGNSLAVRLPKHLVEDLNITEGSVLEITEKDNIVLLKKKQTEITLESLLDQITEENLHEETETFGPVGNEVW